MEEMQLLVEKKDSEMGLLTQEVEGPTGTFDFFMKNVAFS